MEQAETHTHERSTTWKLNQLSASESVQLIRAISLDELGLETQNDSLMAHCASRSHAHKSSGNSESLSVRPSKKYTVVRAGQDVPGGGWVKCYGACGFSGKLSDYLLSIGPAGQAEEFWTNEKVDEVLSTLQKKEAADLGWLEFRRARGGNQSGSAAQIGDGADVRISNSHTLSRFSHKRASLFPDNPDERLIAKVAATRGWQSETIRSAIADGVMGLTPSRDYEDDVYMAFAYRGLTESRHFPERIIKARLLLHSDVKQTIFNPAANVTPIADFSSIEQGAGYQHSPTLAIVEGEPDAITWREMRPGDGVLVMGNENAYGCIPDLVPTIRPHGRRVVYAIDRDVHPSGEWKGKLPIHTKALESLIAAGCEVRVFVCPLSASGKGRPCKDVNDHLQHGSGEDPLLVTQALRAASDLTAVLSKFGILAPRLEPGENGGNEWEKRTKARRPQPSAYRHRRP